MDIVHNDRRLSREHLAELAASAIPAEVAARAEVYTEADPEGQGIARLAGIGPHARAVPGLPVPQPGRLADWLSPRQTDDPADVPQEEVREQARSSTRLRSAGRIGRTSRRVPGSSWPTRPSR